MPDGSYTCASCGDELDIVTIISHGCEPMLAAPDLSRSERSTLLYVEGRMVDHHGELDTEQMNWDDDSNLKLFYAAGMIETEDGEVTPGPRGMSMMVNVTKFTDEAWRLAHDCRRMRAAGWVERDRDRAVDLGDVPA